MQRGRAPRPGRGGPGPGRRGRPARAAAEAGAAAGRTREELKAAVLQVAAATDRGQRMNALVAPMYQEKLAEMEGIMDALIPETQDITEASVSGEWELIYSSVELFRSSPFFLAIERAFNDRSKSDLFFRLHLLQVGSWGASTVGRVGQHLDFEAAAMISTFDTTIFGLTVIPIVGWFKLLPTFGGRVVTLAEKLALSEDGKLTMELERTKVTEVDGLGKIPLTADLLMDRWYRECMLLRQGRERRETDSFISGERRLAAPSMEQGEAAGRGHRGVRRRHDEDREGHARRFIRVR